MLPRRVVRLVPALPGARGVEGSVRGRVRPDRRGT